MLLLLVGILQFTLQFCKKGHYLSLIIMHQFLEIHVNFLLVIFLNENLLSWHVGAEESVKVRM